MKDESIHRWIGNGAEYMLYRWQKRHNSRTDETEMVLFKLTSNENEDIFLTERFDCIQIVSTVVYFKD